MCGKKSIFILRKAQTAVDLHFSIIVLQLHFHAKKRITDGKTLEVENA